MKKRSDETVDQVIGVCAGVAHYLISIHHCSCYLGEFGFLLWAGIVACDFGRIAPVSDEF